MEFAKLVLRTLLIIACAGAILGGSSALICPEAFTLGRPPAFGNLPAPALGLLWGGLEFLVPGAVVGLALGMAANLGERPAVKAMFFSKPLLAHVAAVFAIALLSGLIGWTAVDRGYWFMLGSVAAAVPPEKHALLGAVWWASRGMFVGNVASGIALAVWTWKKRAEFDALVKSGKG